MLKTFLSIGAALIAFAVNAQTNQPPMTDTNAPASTNMFGEHVGKVVDFLSMTGSNWSVIPFAIYSEDTKGGGVGLAAMYSMTDFAGAFLRLDYLEGDIFMPSGNFQLQIPVKLAGKVTVVPFVLGGIATPLSGRGDDNGDPIGIFGMGMGLKVSRKVSVVYDSEVWSKFDGWQHRLGVLWRF